MEIKSRFDHFNINVTDLAKSLEFYGITPAFWTWMLPL